MPPEDENQTIEQLKARQAEVERLIQLEKELDSAQKSRLASANAMFKSSKNAAEENEQLQRRLIELQEEQDKKATDARERQIADIKVQQQVKAAQAEYYAQNKAQLDGLIDQTQKYADDSVTAFRKAGIQGLEELGKKNQQMIKEGEMTTNSMVEAVQGGFKNIGTTLHSISQAPEMILGAITNTLPGISTLKTSILAMPAAMDVAFSSVVKSTNMGAEAAKASMTAMMDPLYAARTDGAFRNLAEDSQLLTNVGLRAEDVGESMTGLINGVAMFRPEFIESNKAQAAFIGNLTAGLKKVGVPIETSAKNLNRFTKAMGKSPKEAATGLKQLTGIADSLGLSFGAVSSNFAAVGGDMVQFGDKAISVFANLQAQATATCMSINELTDFAKGLDTFEGAAQKAQGLNAVLGGTFVSVTDLVNADFDEKIELMQDAMANAGIEFDQADRRMQQVIASAAGLSVEQAAKMFGNKEASEEMRESVDDQALSQEELEGKITDSMSLTEKATRTLSSMGGAVSKFNKRLEAGAEGIAGTVADSFGNLMTTTQNSEAALVGIITQLQGMETAGQIASAAVSGLGEAFLNSPIGAAVATVGGLGLTAYVAAKVQEGYTEAKAKQMFEAADKDMKVPMTTVEKAKQPGAAEMEEISKREAAAKEAAAKKETELAAADQAKEPMTIKLMLPDGRVLAEAVGETGQFLKTPSMLLT